jgi:hypothetical protein
MSTVIIGFDGEPRSGLSVWTILRGWLDDKRTLLTVSRGMVGVDRGGIGPGVGTRVDVLRHWRSRIVSVGKGHSMRISDQRLVEKAHHEKIQNLATRR